MTDLTALAIDANLACVAACRCFDVRITAGADLPVDGGWAAA